MCVALLIAPQMTGTNFYFSRLLEAVKKE